MKTFFADTGFVQHAVADPTVLFLIVNDRFDQALAELQAVIREGEKPPENRPGEITEILAELLGTG